MIYWRCFATPTLFHFCNFNQQSPLQSFGQFLKILDHHEIEHCIFSKLIMLAYALSTIDPFPILEMTSTIYQMENVFILWVVHLSKITTSISLLKCRLSWSAIDRHSSMGFNLFFDKKLISWKVTKLKFVARSSTEFEYQPLAIAVIDIIFLQHLLEECGISTSSVTPLHCDYLFLITFQYFTLVQNTLILTFILCMNTLKVS